MNIDNLENIQKVEVSPFLFTRIQARIKQSKKENMPMGVALVVTVSFALVLIINAVVLINNNPKASTTESLAESMNLTSNNSLY